MKMKIKQTRFRVSSIELKSVESAKNVDSYNILFKDNFEIIEIKDSSLRLVFSRYLGFEPRGLYDLEVKFQVIYHFDNKGNDIVIDHEFISSNIEDFFNEAGISTYIVKLIADISSVGGALPIISPNSFIV